MWKKEEQTDEENQRYKSRSELGSATKYLDYDVDAPLIYAAFMQTYHIDLVSIDYLHWWKFQALLEGLPDECRISKIIGYRTIDTKGMGKSQKAFYSKMKKKYSLKDHASSNQRMKLAERDRRMKEYVQKRFRQGGDENGS